MRTTRLFIFLLNHLSSLRTWHISETPNKKYQRGCRERGTLLHYCKMVQQPLWKTIGFIFRSCKWKYHCTQQPITDTLKEHEDLMPKKKCSILHYLEQLKYGKQPKCASVGNQIKKRLYFHTMEYYSAIRKDECRMEGVQRNMSSEDNQDDKNWTFT